MDVQWRLVGITGSVDASGRLWPILPSGQMLIDQAKAGAPRCLTPGQRRLFHLSPSVPQWCLALGKWPYHEAEAGARER